MCLVEFPSEYYGSYSAAVELSSSVYEKKCISIGPITKFERNVDLSVHQL